MPGCDDTITPRLSLLTDSDRKYPDVIPPAQCCINAEAGQRADGTEPSARAHEPPHPEQPASGTHSSTTLCANLRTRRCGVPMPARRRHRCLPPARSGSSGGVEECQSGQRRSRDCCLASPLPGGDSGPEIEWPLGQGVLTATRRAPGTGRRIWPARGVFGQVCVTRVVLD
jgi:hypothetical protein